MYSILLVEKPLPKLACKAFGKRCDHLFPIGRPTLALLLVFDDQSPDFKVRKHLQPIDAGRGDTTRGLDQGAYLLNERADRRRRSHGRRNNLV